MKTIPLAIIVIFTVCSTVCVGTAYAQYGSGFYPAEHYPPTNDTNLKLIVMNSTDFKIRTAGYNYTLAGIDYSWIPKGNNYYDFGGARVTFLVWGFDNATTKGEAFYLDSQSRIKNIFEYNADNPPAGFYTDRCMGCLILTSPVSPIPQWVRNNVKLWSDGIGSDYYFSQALYYLIDNGILKVILPGGSLVHQTHIPSWIKNDAHWWSDDKISETDFLNAMQYLITRGIIQL